MRFWRSYSNALAYSSSTPLTISYLLLPTRTRTSTAALKTGSSSQGRQVQYVTSRLQYVPLGTAILWYMVPLYHCCTAIRVRLERAWYYDRQPTRRLRAFRQQRKPPDTHTHTHSYDLRAGAGGLELRSLGCRNLVWFPYRTGSSSPG